MDLPCDQWHIAGNNLIHQNRICRLFIQLCKEKMDQTPLPIFIGDTGYIHWNDKIPKGKYCWDLDRSGRFVAVIGDIWMFQRYMNGDRLVWKSIEEPSYWDDINEEIMEQVINRIENL